MINQAKLAGSVGGRLTADHVRLDTLFDRACECVGIGDFERAAAAFAEFAGGLGHHIGVEERYLFPVFDARIMVGGPTTVMRHEHRRIEGLVAQAGAALRAKDAVAFGTDAAELAALLQMHNMKEERVIYPRTDAVLADGESADIVGVLERA